MTDIIVVVILAVLIGAALRYIIKSKKSGARCIGCSACECHCKHPQKTPEKPPMAQRAHSEQSLCRCHGDEK